jgi:hypothetical protein
MPAIIPRRSADDKRDEPAPIPESSEDAFPP